MNQLQAERRAHERQARDWEIKLKKWREPEGMHSLQFPVEIHHIH